MSIGQLYMYKVSYNDSLRRGYCSRLTRDKVAFDRGGYLYDDTINMSLKELDGEVYEYNARIYHKYQKLLEQQKKEREDLLSGKSVVVEAVNKEKWYKRFLRRNKDVT